MNTQKKEKEYNSLGEMAKSRDYKVLYDKLIAYEGTVDMQILTDTNNGIYSELDLLLFNIPRFAFPKEIPQKSKETELDSEINVTAPVKKELCPFFLDVIDVILRNGGNPNTPIVNGITPFMIACTIDNKELIKKMIDNPYSVEDLKSGDLLYQKADVNKGDGRGNRPIFYATMTASLDVMEDLVNEYGIDINKQYFLIENKTILHQVCQNFADKITVAADGLTFEQSENETKEQIIDKLLELGADPTLMDDYENLAEELIPIFDDEIHVAEDISEEEQQIWENMYNKLAAYRKSYETTRVNKFKF